MVNHCPFPITALVGSVWTCEGPPPAGLSRDCLSETIKKAVESYEAQALGGLGCLELTLKSNDVFVRCTCFSLNRAKGGGQTKVMEDCPRVSTDGPFR